MKFSWYPILYIVTALILSACSNGEASDSSEKLSVNTQTKPSSTSKATEPAKKVIEKNAAQTAQVSMSELDPMLKRGRIMWFKCRSCHELGVDKPHKVGPNLNGLIGSPAAAKEGFVYSNAMVNSGVVWDEDALDAFILKPTDYIQGTKMAFVGIKKESDRQALIKYIKENAK